MNDSLLRRDFRFSCCSLLFSAAASGWWKLTHFKFIKCTFKSTLQLHFLRSRAYLKSRVYTFSFNFMSSMLTEHLNKVVFVWTVEERCVLYLEITTSQRLERVCLFASEQAHLLSNCIATCPATTLMLWQRVFSIYIMQLKRCTYTLTVCDFRRDNIK